MYSQRVHSYTNILTLAVSVVLFAITIAVVVLFFLLQYQERQAQTSALEYAVLVKNNVSSSSTLGAAAYSYNKLKKIAELFADAPEYVAQYNYMLKHIILDTPVDISELSLDATAGTKFRFVSENADDLYTVLSRLESESEKKNFSSVSIDSVRLNTNGKQKDKVAYEASVQLQFVPGFNDAEK